MISHGIGVVPRITARSQASRVVIGTAMQVARKKTVVLTILDGWGNGPDRADNAVTRGNAPQIRALRAQYPSTLLGASGPAVGLPDGQMGNSEVGHLNLGAGRVASTDLSRIDVAVANGSFANTSAIAALFASAKAQGGRVHLVGLLSDGGVHSSIEHWFAAISAARAVDLAVVAHPFLDGRDVAPGSALGFVAQLHDKLAACCRIGSVGGRFFGMDRDNRWERIELAYRAMVEGVSQHRAQSAAEGILLAAERGESDEFVTPFVVGDYAGIDAARDVVLHLNFRPDRAREFSHAIYTKSFGHFARPRGALPHYLCMTEYDAGLAAPIAFSRVEYTDTLGEVVARAGMKQLRCAETEKYAHVTYFFSGGSEALFKGEERKLVPSPKEVRTYDEKPEMSAEAVTQVVLAAIASGQYDLIVVNYANPDMVGHTGNLQAAKRAVEVVDGCVARLVTALLRHGGEMLLTADHGNCEQMIDPQTGAPFTAHTLNLVDCTLISTALPAGAMLRSDGCLADVAPTLLARLGVAQPTAMTGVDLVRPATREA